MNFEKNLGKYPQSIFFKYSAHHFNLILGKSFNAICEFNELFDAVEFIDNCFQKSSKQKLYKKGFLVVKTR